MLGRVESPLGREWESREKRGGAVVKRMKGTVFPDPPRGIYSKFQISGVSGLRAGVSG